MNRDHSNNDAVKQQDEFEDKVVTIKRVTKVVKGGRNMRFSALVVVGDKKGHVGVGIGKSIEIPEAIRKGKEDAMKHLVTVALDENGSVPHDYTSRFSGSSIVFKRAGEGVGIIAGGAVRSVLELAGFKNVRSKILGSNNKKNVVLATLKGLGELKTPEQVAAARGIAVSDLV
jgi:small subunit ribosomal protein S5